MIFKNRNRKKQSNMLCVITAAIVFSLFFYRVLDFSNLSFFIAICIVALFLIIVISLYEEVHIMDKLIKIKCFYYEKIIYPHEIAHVIIRKNNVIFYKKNKKVIHTFLNMNNARFEALVIFIDKNKIKYNVK